ncbi:general transcription factor IIH subunit 4-like [Planoprotostelium fungivorum]|uniref:General transcription factor IIH subunit 4 n=1 Tax=Planoprotostelium fungivorum TaxID=1890364 RepID=A0A2P6MTX0_9EUKA|nr:general transcription factor IIH subunit 4-like [Planoprotostelium fungivorum]PRP80610.1 general transcription factor IIH subunit 4-like [Planoprotostelium fungivorum]
MATATTVFDYLISLPRGTLHALYADPWTCQAIFRDLHGLAKQYVVRLMFVSTPMSLSSLLNWVKPDEISQHKDCLEKLIALHVCEEVSQPQGHIPSKNPDGNRFILLNKTFQMKFNDTIASANQESWLKPLEPTVDQKKIEKELQEYSQRCFDAILNSMLNPKETKSLHPSIQRLVLQTGLMEEAKNSLHITSKGFQFLLWDTYTQIWTLLLAYLSTTENQRDALSLIFQLSFLKMGQHYSTNHLSPSHLRIIQDLSLFGLIYQRRENNRTEKSFYPTRLAIALSSTQSAAHNGNTHTHTSSSEGYIMIEQNYRMYAYTNSPLQIAVLKQFVKITYKLPNMVMGMISRESVRDALRHGITANQMIGYMRQHAHPEMLKNFPVVPETVADQIRLWETERSRIKYEKGIYYEKFPSPAAQANMVEYAKQLGVLLWSSDAGFFAKESDLLKEYIKKVSKA